MLSDVDYEKAYDFVAAHEGLDSDHPNDGGGRTRYGITQRFLDANALQDKVTDLNKVRAKEIFHDYIWKPCKYASLNDLDVATKIFDMNVNMGPTQAHLLFQRAINEIKPHLVKADGIIGPKTLEAANDLSVSYKQRLLQELRLQCIFFYTNLVLKRPDQKIFLNGWLRRAID